jgi:hypothetical protein
MATITLFKRVNLTNAPYYIDDTEVLDMIRSGKYKEVCDQIAAEPDKKQRGKLKVENLVVACWGGEFQRRAGDGLINPSGLACLDIDGLTGNYQAVWDTLQGDAFVYAMFRSPSGDGIKVIVKVPADGREYNAHYESLLQHFAPVVTSGGKLDNTPDISWACFIPSDPNLYHNPDSETYTNKVEKEVHDYKDRAPVLLLNNDDKIFDKLLKWLEKKGDLYVDGNRNWHMFKLASACNRFGLSKDYTESRIQSLYEVDSERELRGTINSAYSKTSEHNTKFFEDKETIDMVTAHINRGSNTKKVTDLLMKAKGMTEREAKDTVEAVLEQELPDDGKFWTTSVDRNGKVKVSFLYGKLSQLLANNGIYRLSLGKDSWNLIKIKNNVVRYFERDEYFTFLLDFVQKSKDPNSGYVEESLRRAVGTLTTDSIMLNVQRAEINWHKDTKDKTFLYFQNKVVAVDKKGAVISMKYHDLDGFIWDTQILKRNFELADSFSIVRQSDYARFVSCISSHDKHRIEAMESAIGYLLCGYKNRSYSPAVILNDESISDDPNGGTGKGIFVTALKNFKRVANIDGKQWKPDKSFLYQQVNLDTQIMAFEDVRQGFDFEQLFSVITEGVVVEKKGETAFEIPFDTSPKVLITTNYTIKGSGNSHVRRRFELEFAQYFRHDHTPLQEFGRMLFDDWEDADWLMFDNYMVFCLMRYMVTGLQQAPHVNLEYKLIVAETNKDFMDWISEKPLKERIYKAEWKDNFVEDYPEMKVKPWFTPNAQRLFNKWMERYMTYKGIKFEDSHNNGLKFWQILTDGPALPEKDDDIGF